jgi:peroxiredoxin
MSEKSCEELVGKTVPWFARESSQGKIVARDPSGQTPRVLIFCPSPETVGCREYLRAMERDRETYARLYAEVVIVAAGDYPTDLPFAVIANAPDLFQAFGFVDAAGNPLAGVAVVDRYGQVEACYVGADFGQLPGEDVVARRLEGAEAQCPECGVPEARWLEVS